MRQSYCGACGSCPRERIPAPSSALLRASRGKPLAIVLAALLASSASREAGAQITPTAPAPAAKAQAPSTTAATTPTPLTRFVAKDNLVLYLAFEGLDAHADAWRKTAAYKMLNETSLGEMLSDVAAQVFDKLLSLVPNRKITGTELVSLIETASRKGWVIAMVGPRNGKPPYTTVVLRGMASKSTRKLSSGALGMAMGPDARPKIERKASRILVVVPSGPKPENSWVWWPEKNEDLVITAPMSGLDTTLDVLDGKLPSAADHPAVTALAKAENGFVPLMTALLDPLTMGPGLPDSPASKINDLESTAGLKRFEYRWGFQEEALQGELRIVAPSPRKGPLALFESKYATIGPNSMIPMPEGVELFVLLSIPPAKLMETLGEYGPPDMKAQIDAFAEGLKNDSRIDLEKDFLAHLGPKIGIFLAPQRSAATTEDAAELPMSPAGINPAGVMSMLQSRMPKPIMVAEIDDPTSMRRSLAALMIAVNKELKARAVEKAAEEEAEAARTGTGGGPGGMAPGGRGQGRGDEVGIGGGNNRQGRRRSPRDVSAPEFRRLPSPAGAGDEVMAYILGVPADSPLKLGTAGMRPTVRLEGRYLVLAPSGDGARLALDVVKKKGWTPSPDVQGVLGHLPKSLMALAVSDPKESLPGLLSGLPGTVQVTFNTLVTTMSNSATAGRPPGAPPGNPGMGAAFGPGGPQGMVPPGAAGAAMARRRGRDDAFPGGPGGPGSPGFQPGMMAGGFRPGGFAGAPGGPSPAASQDAMLQLKIDSSRLPKADELKSYIFPTTYALSVEEQSIRLVWREAFPSPSMVLGGGATVGALTLPAIAAARTAAREQAARDAAANAPPGTQATTGPGGAPPPGGRPNLPGAPGGRRGRRDD